MKKRKSSAGKSSSSSGGSKSSGHSQRKHTPRIGRPGPAMIFRQAFDQLWGQLFSSPVHLDSALSRSTPSVKSTLAPLSRVILQRPASLAHFLRFRLYEGEPWNLEGEYLANWQTARAMAARLYQIFKKDSHFADEGFPVEEDFPPFMIEEWKREFGVPATRELVQTLGSPAPLGVRAARIKGGRNAVLSALNDSKELEIRGKISRVAPLGFSFDDYAPILGHPDFKKGNYEIQDEGSQVMALFALWPREFLPMLRKVPGSCREWPQDKELPKAGNWTVIDTCAGAGGKTLAMADAMLGKGQVFAYDISAKKLAGLQQRFRRAGLTNIKGALISEGNEKALVKKFESTADRVLIDAPCSGWGVLRRNPDLKWRQDPSTLERLEDLQAYLLDAYAPLVKVGGYLTYGVCTFRHAETQGQVAKFRERHPNFESIGGGYLGPGPTDGFFFHAFERKS